jgi:FkbM family methyltransferase
MTLTEQSEPSAMLERILRFLHKPFHEKANYFKQRYHSFLSRFPMPTRLPFGAWWIKRNDNLAETLLTGSFEAAELAFVEKLLQPGMIVLDIGAHQGLYTLLASKRVGPSGRVFSFEPSPRERRALRLNLALNFCRNVSVQGLAVGNQETTADLFVVQGSQTGCNSLRPPDILGSTKPVRVRVTSLDQWLPRNGISRVDFIKVDVEGAELEVLKGAVGLLQKRPRPVILAEVQDVRTGPWGYRAKDILTLLLAAGYAWFRTLPNGSLERLDLTREVFDGNFVACPGESTAVLNDYFLPRL